MMRAYQGLGLQLAEVWADITLADGTKIDRQLLDRRESLVHRARRYARTILPYMAMILAGSMGMMSGATVITNAGQAIVTNRITGAGTEPKFVMWGTGAGTAAVTDTTLFTETTDEARTTGTSSRVTTTVTNDTYQVVGTITVATAGKTITNVGLFDVVTASSGNLYFKSDFTGLALAIGDSITFTLKIKYT